MCEAGHNSVMKQGVGRRAPTSRRGMRTRAALLSAAREVFERDGFVDARMVDISAAAGAATGSLYTYFTDKNELFAALLEQLSEDMLHPGVHLKYSGDDPVRLIEESIRAYLNNYRRNAKLMWLFDQVASIDQAFATMRTTRGKDFVRRNTRFIRALQDSGAVDADLDAAVVSLALTGMVGRTAHSVYVSRSQRVEFEKLVATLTRLWVNALGLRP